ncbi:cell morphogenesis N-terminal-domain-containing protein [Ephemerocybe angulata]|uniref:Cell morphogenesis N-terminal-domain-containing protein n=1 Tax=Ephemerocybe angulata TaxID=980116 RepID=A0A8H6I5D7_9AGAR|nr:cell morphogenesis N-terminal-domain-containing protein [Tulosesus angulatus]
MSEGIQITIPDFDDDDVRSAPIPFGRSAFGFGGFGSDSPGGQSVTTPLAGFGEKSFFHHARGDSSASIDSTNSATTRFASKPSTPFGHTSQPSISTGSTGFTKKPSFASIRNAFKSGKSSNNDAPPPSSLNHHHAPSPTPRSNGFIQRPSTSGSTDTPTPRFGRSKSKSHIQAKSQHSHTGSIFNMSDAGSDYGQGYFSPPPVPRVPGAFRSDTPPPSDFEEDKVVMDPKTPSDYALHAIFIRFASQAEGKIDAYLQQPLEPELPFERTMGPGVDPKFDETLQSLAIIAQKKAKPVIDSVMRWRRTQNDHDYGSNVVVSERKSMASIYIMCRALVTVLQSITKDALGDSFGYTIEETFFEQFKRPDSRHQSSVNHRSNTELYAALLGQLAKVRFITVTDRFLGELSPVTSGNILKDNDNKYENLVRGMRYIQIKVWPPEAFEEGAEFMESLSKTYVNTHGLRLKVAFAEILVSLLHPIGKTAQAETNIPQWAKAIEMIYPKAREMMSKPRYWQVAYPLAITALCVGPQTYFLKHWQACFDAMVPKLKDKPSRLPILNGMMRLVWTYIYRCQETPSTTMGKLETMLKHILPTNRLTAAPAEDTIDFLTYMAHFMLSRHFEYGKEFCLDLMQEPTIASLQKTGNIASALAPERTAIGVNAILLTLSMLEREAPTPSWPSSSDFYAPVPKDDYPTSSAYLPATLLARPAIKDLLEHVGSALAAITNHCANLVGSMSVFDEQWSPAKQIQYEERDNYVIRRHPSVGVTVAYQSKDAPNINLLETCFQAWPRCLHSSILIADAVDLLLKGVVHVDPFLSETASAALKRFMDDSMNALTVVARFTSYLFSPVRITHETSGPGMTKLHIEAGFLVGLWVEIVETWLRKVMTMTQQEFEEEKDIILSKCDDLEAAGLFLLSHEMPIAHSAGIKVVRLLGLLASHLATINVQIDSGHLLLVGQLHGKGEDLSFLTGFDNILDRSQLARLEQWRQLKKEGILLRIADSNSDKDPQLWRYIFPAFLKTCMDHCAGTLTLFREIVIAAVSRYHPVISHFAGLTPRVPAALVSRGDKAHRDNRHLVDQWHMWVKILCSTAILPDSSRMPFTPLGRDHNRAPSDVNFERERLSTSRGLFRYLTPFLDSEHTSFRDAAVQCISSFPANTYLQLLDDLSLLAGRQFYEDARSKTATPHMMSDDPRFRSGSASSGISGGGGINALTRRQERLHSAVARIYCLTAHHLQHQWLPGRQAAHAHVLKFVQNTQTFLSSPESKENFSLQRLRRYFCGTVERLFDGLATLENSDRFIPKHMHLSLYRLCEKWCQIGPQSESAKRRMDVMVRAAGAAAESSEEVTEAVDRFKVEASMLSYAAIGALTSLCQKAFFPADTASASPTERQSLELAKPLTALQVLERLTAILASSHKNSQAKAKKGLKSLLTYTKMDPELPVEALRRAAVVSNKMDTTNERVFEVVSEIICKESHHFTFEQVVCLGLTNLRHPTVKIRSMAFTMLEAIHQQSSGLLTMSNFEAAVSSHAAVSDFLAGEHPHQAIQMLMQLGYWLPSLPAETAETNTILLLLQSLEFWIPNINLMTDDRTQHSNEGLSCLYHLMSMSLRYSASHAEQILILWAKLVEPPNQSNGHATVRFLLEQSHKVGNTIYVACAANIVACREIFTELCSVIEPVRMLPVIDHKLAFPEAEDMELWADLDALFAEQPRLTLGSAQFAWLFLTDVTLQRHWEMKAQLPVLLHITFTHLDHRVPFVRSRARSMVFQLLRSWTPGYDELQERSSERSRKRGEGPIAALEREVEEYYWKEDDTSEEVEPKMQWLCQKVLHFLDPLVPSLASHWGSLALEWGTSCSIRATAFRSLQIFRALMPRVKTADFALLLGRLSNTVSSADPNIQHFTSEIFLTLHAVINAQDKEKALLPQMFWCLAACLSTTVESEFSQCLDLLETLLARMNLDDPATAEALHSQMPLDWTGPQCLQPTLLKGLRSSVTAAKTMKILQTLAKIQDAHFIDPSDARLRDLYTAARAARGAGRQDKHPAHHELFAKNAFRTRDDFLRQSVSTLREHYGARNWTDYRDARWVRTHAMQVVKTRNPVELLGSELLMPLLRLLETELAPQALEVLEEPILDVRMQIPNLMKQQQQQEADSGNVIAVFDTCSVPTRPSRIDFEPEVEALASIKTPNSELMQVHQTPVVPIPTRRLEARVAAILAKSTAPDFVSDMPQTPFIDVFRIGSGGEEGLVREEESEEDTDSDSDADSFIFDSVTSPRRPAVNGSSYH